MTTIAYKEGMGLGGSGGFSFEMGDSRQGQWGSILRRTAIAIVSWIVWKNENWDYCILLKFGPFSWTRVACSNTSPAKPFDTAG